MKSKQFYQTLSNLLVCGIVLTAVLVLSLIVLLIVKIVVDEPQEPPVIEETDSKAEDAPTSGEPVSIEMGTTSDRGMTYIDGMVFIGESTTSHLVNRGVLTDGKDTLQVWSKSDNTRTLSSKTTSEIINVPSSVSGLTIAQACAAEQPEYVVLSFGLNGSSEFIKNNCASYKSNYNALIKAIQTASPNTKIILQTVYPITAPKDGSVGAFPDIDTTNRNLSILNHALSEIAATHTNVRVCDTASVLRNGSGRLTDSYNDGDGIHLTASAYEAILYYLRTHAWQ